MPQNNQETPEKLPYELGDELRPDLDTFIPESSSTPYDMKDMAHSLVQALSLDENEKKLRMQRLFELVQYYDIDDWGKTFVQELEKV